MSIHYDENFKCKKCNSEFVPWKKQGTGCPTCGYLNKGEYYPFIDFFFESLVSNLVRGGSIIPGAWYAFNDMDHMLFELFRFFGWHYEQDKKKKLTLEQKAKHFFKEREIQNEQKRFYKNPQYFIDLALAIDEEFEERRKKILKKFSWWKKIKFFLTNIRRPGVYNLIRIKLDKT